MFLGLGFVFWHHKHRRGLSKLSFWSQNIQSRGVIKFDKNKSCQNMINIQKRTMRVQPRANKPLGSSVYVGPLVAGPSVWSQLKDHSGFRCARPKVIACCLNPRSIVCTVARWVWLKHKPPRDHNFCTEFLLPMDSDSSPCLNYSQTSWRMFPPAIATRWHLMNFTRWWPRLRRHCALLALFRLLLGTRSDTHFPSQKRGGLQESNMFAPVKFRAFFIGI